MLKFLIKIKNWIQKYSIKENKMLLRKEFYLLPVKEMVIFPNSSTVLIVNNQRSILTVENAYLNNEKILCVAEKSGLIGDVNKREDLYDVGTMCEITQKVSSPSGELRVFVKGIDTYKLEKLTTKDGCLFGVVKEIRKTRITENIDELERVKKVVLNKAEMFFSHHTGNSLDLIQFFKNIQNNNDIIYILTNILNIDVQAKQSVLEERSVTKQFIKINQYLEIEKSLINTEREINDKIDRKLQEHQKQFYLREKLKVIRDELKDKDEIDGDGDKDDIKQLKNKFQTLLVNDDVKEKFNNEIKKLSGIPTFSPEYSNIKDYLDWIVSLPWNKSDSVITDIKKAEEILNRDHYGLDEIKERIVEFLAVLQKTNKLSGPIICLVGPPGVGKTSLAKSIAEATNRKYIKISLGGVRDEAEIRGHRRTYVGSMPGKVIQSMRKAKTNNPLILLDEIDKMSSDYKGDPTSAMLEVLDPEQNKSFNDHFLELEYDLSNVMFIATANSLQEIPIPLRDRMEIIKLSGYTEDEKLQIAKKYLIKKQLELHGLNDGEFKITDEAIVKIIRNYTFEAGVRNLERNIETLIRKTTKKLVENSRAKKVVINVGNLKDYLGVEKNSYNEANKEDKVGVSTGLAYTEFGGDLLYIEALKFDGSGKLLITGKLGDVMKESVEAAFSYVRSKASEIGITSKVFNKYDFHIHVPEGATPKDGPSAGVAISSALMSTLSGLKVRSDTAMTGEITLTGKVLPIGGLKEKLLAALRGNIKNVLIPQENVKDLEKIPDKVKKGLNIKAIKTIEEAFEFLLVGYSKRKGKSNIKTKDKTKVKAKVKVKA